MEMMLDHQTAVASESSTTDAPLSSDAEHIGFHFHGSGGALFTIMLVNWLLTMVTLGIYAFWARVKEHVYLFNETEFGGNRFSYHGTGKELLLGSLKAFAILIILSVGAAFLPQVYGVIVLYLGMILMVPLALHGSRRYQLSRTSWRGIRFSFRGALSECYRIYLLQLPLSVLTLGIYYPQYCVAARRYWTEHTYFGNTPFTYHGSPADLALHFAPFHQLALLVVLIAWILPEGYQLMFGADLDFDTNRYLAASLMLQIAGYVLLGIAFLYWKAHAHRYHWAHTTLAGGTLCSSLTGGALLRKRLWWIVLLIITLGFGYAWVRCDQVRFYTGIVTMPQEPQWEQIERALQDVEYSATGEGLAAAFDLDLGFGVA